MIESIKGWWRNHGAGERALMGVLGVAILIVFLWLGVWRPVNEALDTGWARQSAALDRFAVVQARIEALKQAPAQAVGQGPRTPIEQLVSQSAAEAGFTLDRVGNQGAGRMSISIGAARTGPLLAWIGELEAAGVGVQSINIVPGATDGTVAVQAVLQERRP
ncbi:MAG TPA: type II secretion system protein GspM [Sphingobium sp.]|nr:type II secretion system protein GspM [Sphingobium sp.]